MGSSEQPPTGIPTERTDVPALSTSGPDTAADRWSPSTPPAQEWQSQWHNAIPELEELARRRIKPADVVIMRASQLDAARLDTELTAMLKEQFLKVFTYFQPRVITALQPELSLVLQLLIFRFSVWAGKPTPGSALMNLRYRDERTQDPGPQSPSAAASSCRANATQHMRGGRTGVEGPGLTRWQKGLWGFGTVLVQYAWSRLDQIAAAYYWEDPDAPSLAQKVWLLARRCENLLSLASLANFVVFLYEGKYRLAECMCCCRSLLERLLSARLVYLKANMARAISFEYLNRQLVWHELSELLLFILPLVSVTRIKRMVTNRWPSLRAATAKHLQRASGLAPPSQRSLQASPGSCAICNAYDIAVPFQAVPCKHVFCYYCLRTNCEADTQFECPLCAVRVSAMQRWYPDGVPDPTGAGQDVA